MAKRRFRPLRTVILLAVLVFAALTAYKHVGQPLLYPQKYQDLVTKYTAEYELPPSLVYAVIRTESHFVPDAESSAGAKGLMQLTEGTYMWVQTKIPGEPEPLERMYDPEVNIRCGCKVLQVLIEQFDHVETALAAYNAGSGNVSKWLRDPAYSQDGETLSEIPFEETRNYVQRVLLAQEKYQSLYNLA